MKVRFIKWVHRLISPGPDSGKHCTHILLIIISILFQSSATYAAYPGEGSKLYCGASVLYNPSSNAYNSSPPVLVQSNGTLIKNDTGPLTLGPVYKNTWFNKYYENGNWLSAGSVESYRHEQCSVEPHPVGPPNPCENEEANLIESCGGASNVDWSNWNDETCTGGKCIKECDQPGQETYSQAQARCMVQEKTLSEYNPDICKGICGCTETEIQDAYASCGPFPVIGFSDVTCSAVCGNCDDKGNEADAVCGSLYAASWECDAAGNVINVECSNVPPDDNDLLAEPSPTPEPGTNPNPEPNPPDNPEQPQDEKSNALLSTIKKDTGNMVAQGNTTNGYLLNIAENQRKSVDNQKAADKNAEQRHNEDQQKQGEIRDGIGQLNDGIGQLNDGMGAINDTLGSMKFDGVVPGPGDVPSFDMTLDEGYDYNEFSDSVGLGQSKAEEQKLWIEEQIPPDDTGPVSAILTAEGDACMNGSISLNGNSVPINICFDHPWMLTGYAIMKIILIGVGYLQTAMLLNRAIVA